MSVHCEIREYQGVPTVHVDGRPLLLVANKNGPQEARYYTSFHQAGYFAYVSNNKISEVWLGPDTYDFSALDANVQRILKVNSKALILLEFHANAPSWWEQAYPDELQMDLTGARIYGQSMASRVWRSQCGEAARRCVAHVESRYGENVIGYFVGAGHTWEWFYRTPLRYVVDYSDPMVRAFREWLRVKYGGCVDRLRAAWGMDEVTFENAPLPTKIEEVETDCRSFRDPSRRQKVLDFYEFYPCVMTEAIEHFARLVKRETNSQKLFGVFYGHLLDWISNPLTAQHSGHLGLGRLIRSPDIDIFAGPNSYMDRDIGSAAHLTSATDSFKLHGKLWVSETDTRTHLADLVQDCCGRPDSLQDSLTVLKRDFAQALIKGVEMVWFSLFDGWYDDDEIMKLMRKMRTIATSALHTDRRSVSEIAVIVDERSPWVQGLTDTYIVDPFISKEPRGCDLVARMGAPYDVYLLTDLEDERTHRYKLYLFLNAFYVSARTRRIIRECLKKDQKTLLYLYAPGFADDDGLSVENMEDLTGMRFGLNPVPSELFVRVTDPDHPLIGGDLNLGDVLPTWVDGDFESCFGVNKSVGPLFYCKDEEADALGTYTCDGRTGFAVKYFGDWTSIFLGTPFAPPAILRGAARAAGVHLYHRTQTSAKEEAAYRAAGWNPTHIYNPQDDILYANNSFLSLHSKHGGNRTIRLPREANVYDVFEGQMVGEGISEFSVHLPPKSTVLYYIGQEPWRRL